MTDKKKRRSAGEHLKLKYTALVLCVIIVILLIAKCAVSEDGGKDGKETKATEKQTTVTTEVETEPLPVDYAEVIKSIEGRLASPTVFVYDMESDEYIYQKNVKTVIYPASMTVLWTSLYSMSVIEPETVITVTSEALALVPKGSVTAKIYKEQQLTLSMLIEGMVVASGCDCAYVVAVEVGRTIAKNPELPANEAVERFILGINEWLENNGFIGTVIEDPYGLSGSTHYTTVQDLTLTAKYALKDRVMSDYLATYSQKVYYASGQSNTWTSKNLILNPTSEYYCEFATGVKAGTINKQNSLLSACKLEEDGKTRFIIGAFGSETSSVRFDDTKLIIDTLVAASAK